MKIGGFELEPWMVAVPIGVAGLATLAYVGVSALTDRSSLPAGVIPPRPFQGVPFAKGRSPAWPVLTSNQSAGVVSYVDVNGNTHGNWDRRFGASRDGRYHVGMDIYANAGDPVIAMADGVVTAVQSFHLGSWSMFVASPEVVIMYGEIEPQSWRDFGVVVGSSVKKGQRIARIACMRWSGSSCASHMLHLETYRPGTTKNHPWYAGRAAPSQILDPTWLILQARGAA